MNFLADGSLLERTREYRLDSLMMVSSCKSPRVSHFVTPFSSVSIWSISAFLGLLYPSAFVTSLPTSHGLPLISTDRILSNSGLLNTCNFVSGGIVVLLFIKILVVFQNCRFGSFACAFSVCRMHLCSQGTGLHLCSPARARRRLVPTGFYKKSSFFYKKLVLIVP